MAKKRAPVPKATSAAETTGTAETINTARRLFRNEKKFRPYNLRGVPFSNTLQPLKEAGRSGVCRPVDENNPAHWRGINTAKRIWRATVILSILLILVVPVSLISLYYQSSTIIQFRFQTTGLEPYPTTPEGTIFVDNDPSKGLSEYNASISYLFVALSLFTDETIDFIKGNATRGLMYYLHYLFEIPIKNAIIMINYIGSLGELGEDFTPIDELSFENFPEIVQVTLRPDFEGIYSDEGSFRLPLKMRLPAGVYYPFPLVAISYQSDINPAWNITIPAMYGFMELALDGEIIIPRAEKGLYDMVIPNEITYNNSKINSVGGATLSPIITQNTWWSSIVDLLDRSV